MIILQIFAGLMLIPLTLLALITFNIFIRHWLWQLGVVSFGLLYAGTAAVLFLSWSALFWFWLGFGAFYLWRSRNMALRLKEKEGGKDYPIVKGDILINHSKFRISFVFPLSFLNIAKYTPDALNRKISRESGLKINMEELIPALLINGKGTEVSLYADGNEVYFEIQ